MEWFFVTSATGVTSVALAAYLYRYVDKQDSGTEKMREIAYAITEGAKAYLRRQNTTLVVFALLMAMILGILFSLTEDSLYGASVAMAYLFGSLCTAAAAYVGMMAAVKANVRTASAARIGLKKSFSIAFYGGAVMGLSIVGLSLLGISLLFYIYFNVLGWLETYATNVVLGFSFGASALALFAKAGGPLGYLADIDYKSFCCSYRGF